MSWLFRLNGVVLGLAVLSAPLRAGVTEPLLPPDTESCVVINVRQILDSPLFKKHLLAPIRRMMDDKGNELTRGILADLGTDPLKDLDRVIIASPTTKDTDRGLILLQGRFNLARIRQKGEEAARDNAENLRLHPTSLGGGKSHLLYEVVIPNREDSLFAAMLDQRTMALSPGKDYVVEAVRKHQSGNPAKLASSAFAEMLGKMDEKQCVGVAIVGEKVTLPESDAVTRLLREKLGGLEGVGGGVTIDEDIKVEVLLAGPDREKAESLHKAMDKGLRMAVAGLSLLGEERQELDLLLEVVKCLRVVLRGNSVVLVGKVPQNVIEDFFKKDE